MATVINLPDKSEREWRVCEGHLRDAMQVGGHVAPEAEYAISKLKPVFIKANRYPFKAQLTTGNAEDLMADLNAWVQAQVFVVMLEVMERDMELFRLRGRA